MNSIIDAIKNYKVKVVNINQNQTQNDNANSNANDNANKSIINEKIKKIYVINLIDDEIKRNYIITLMNKYKINFTLVIVERISNDLYKTISDNSSTFISKGELGCCLSHLWCLYKIILNNYANNNYY